MIRTVKDYEKLSEQYNKMLEERNSLIDDLSWYKAKVSRLERDNEDLKFTKKMHLGYIKYFSNNNELLRDEVKSLKQENKTLCKPDVVFELQKDLQERCDRAIDLKEENTQLKESRDWDYEYIVKVNEENKRLEDENEQLKKENEMIDEQFTDYIDETCGYLKLLSEFSQHIGNKPSSSTYKYFRGKLNALEIREGE